MIMVRWARGRPRRGPVRERLDPSWGFEGIPCRCGLPLDIGWPVRVLALGPWAHDEAANVAYHAGGEHDASALVLHDRCVTDEFVAKIDVSAGTIETPRGEVETLAAWHGIDTRFAPAVQEAARKFGLTEGDLVAEFGTALELLAGVEEIERIAELADTLPEAMRKALLRLYGARKTTPPRSFFVGSTANRTANVGQFILANTAYALQGKGLVAIGHRGRCALTDTGLLVAEELHRQWLTDHPAPLLSPPKRGHLRVVADDDAGAQLPYQGPHG